MAKNNARTFRYSDEVAAILLQHNNDFDALVLECFYRLPTVQEESKRIADYNNQLLKERKQLYTDIQDLQEIKTRIQYIEQALKDLAKKL